MRTCGRVSLTSGEFQLDGRRNGHVLVASGWQADIPAGPGVESLEVPTARKPDGSSIKGRVVARFFNMAPGSTTLPILRGGVVGTAHPVTLDSAHGVLTQRRSEWGSATPLAPTDWAFADCTSTPFPGKPDPRKLCLKTGFDPAYLYELVYTAKDPKVHGIGFAATRDLNSYLRRHPSSPLRGGIKAAISQGNSQSGN